MLDVDFSSARVAILGTGREGRAAWRYLRSRFPAIELVLVDEKEPDPSFSAGLTAADRVAVGPLTRAELDSFDVLIRSPGISPYRASLQRAAAAGTTITTSSSLWFAAHADQKTICVTGTKGKSTTSALLAHILGSGGLSVRLAGNIGKPLLDCDDRDVDWWVIELSSYQLVDLEARPTVAVILNLSPEHLDWHGDEAVYRRDKLRLARLTAGGPIVANAADRTLRSELAGFGDVRWFNHPDGFRVAGRRLLDAADELAVTLPPGLPGAHNLSNIAAALTVARTIGFPFEAAIEALPSFRPLPHRLQVLGERAGVRFINDSISSTPVATIAALESLSGEAVTLIVGGFERGLDWASHWQAFAAAKLQAVIGVPDNGARLVESLRAAGVRPQAGLHDAPDLETAVSMARRMTPSGGVVLLSPGAPSFPRFSDYRDRGRRFAEWCGFRLDESDQF